MPKAIKKVVPKKTAGAEAEIKDKLATLKYRMKERQKPVLRYGVGILVVIIAIVGFLLYNHTLHKKARMFEYEAYKTYHNDYIRQPVSREEQYKKALDMFKKAYDIRRSPVSLFYIAGCYHRLGKYDDALKILRDFIQRYSDEDGLIPLVYHKMAMVYVKKGDLNEAMKTLDTLYNLGSNIYKDFVLMEYSRLLERAGKLEEAKKKYKELTDRFPDSPFSEEAEAKLKKD